MLNRNSKRQFLSCMLLLTSMVVIGGQTRVFAADDINGSVLLRPKVIYQAQNRRDPFVKPSAGQFHHVIEQVDIESLKLTGIIRNPNQATALFTTQTGPKFGFLLKAGKLYRENHQSINGITGEIINPKEVILRQDGRTITFKLR